MHFAPGAELVAIAGKPAVPDEQHLIDERIQAPARFQRAGYLHAAKKALRVAANPRDFLLKWNIWHIWLLLETTCCGRPRKNHHIYHSGICYFVNG